MLGRAVSALPNFLSWSSHLLSPSSLVSSTNTVSTVNPSTTTKNINNQFIPSNQHTSTASTNYKFNPSSHLSNGLLYLKGGNFTQELLDAEIDIHHIKLYPVSEVLPGLISDKYVLYIPADDIIQFHNKKIKSQSSIVASSQKSKTNKK